jgi:hypothetical protein
MNTEKGPGDIKYPTGKAKSLKKMPDGNPYPYESTYEAENGVQDEEVANGKRSFDYTPEAPSNVGDDGKG